uniref:Uncharacterized protein n=1 Tax=Spongospora subterranea TaxID=70186 RepID=A0A0H5R6H6_9EUKA|eukprot:CRZ09733.1 hypothetical protein [Spongospora subterranea]
MGLSCFKALPDSTDIRRLADNHHTDKNRVQSLPASEPLDKSVAQPAATEANPACCQLPQQHDAVLNEDCKQGHELDGDRVLDHVENVEKIPAEAVVVTEEVEVEQAIVPAIAILKDDVRASDKMPRDCGPIPSMDDVIVEAAVVNLEIEGKHDLSPDSAPTIGLDSSDKLPQDGNLVPDVSCQPSVELSCDSVLNHSTNVDNIVVETSVVNGEVEVEEGSSSVVSDEEILDEERQQAHDDYMMKVEETTVKVELDNDNKAVVEGLTSQQIITEAFLSNGENCHNRKNDEKNPVKLMDGLDLLNYPSAEEGSPRHLPEKRAGEIDSSTLLEDDAASEGNDDPNSQSMNNKKDMRKLSRKHLKSKRKRAQLRRLKSPVSQSL